MLNRWLAGAIAVAAFALVAMPTAGQAPQPACPAGAQVAPDRFEFTEDPDTSPTQSVAATHPVALFIGVDGGSLTSVTDPAIQIAGPPGLAVTREPQYDDTTHLKVDFTPAAPGPLTFTATWTQLTQPGGSPCTASASATVAVTAPTLARASRQLGYALGHRPGKAGTPTSSPSAHGSSRIRGTATAAPSASWCARWRACTARLPVRPPPP